MSSQRKRADRGRNGGASSEPVEIQIWESCKETASRIEELITRSDTIKDQIFALEAEYAALAPKQPSVKQLDALSALVREQIKISEQIVLIAKTGPGGMTSLLENLNILKALLHHETGDTDEKFGRGRGREAAGNKQPSVDPDAAFESPAPSPAIEERKRKKGFGESAGRDRSSVPPVKEEKTVKQESVGLEYSGAETNAKGKIIYQENAEVAFRPKNSDPDREPEWIQGVVVKVIGEGKSRRYDVQDPEPDEVTKKPGAVYRTSAASMVPIPSLGAPLPDYPKGKHVLARYPDTTTFYRAEVVGMNRANGCVILRFEGEEDEATTWEVDRRFVLDHKWEKGDEDKKRTK